VVKLSGILKDYREAGALHTRIALWGFIDQHTFLTKAGALGLVYHLKGIDYECLDHAERRDIAQRFERALRQLDESIRVYQYLVKRPAAPIATTPHAHPVVNAALERRAAYLSTKAHALFELDLYFVILYEGWKGLSSETGIGAGLASTVLTKFKALAPTHTISALDTDLRQAVGHLRQKASAFTAQLADTVAPVLLPKDDAFRFFRQLLNYAPHKVDPVTRKYDTHLDIYVGDSEVECHRDHLLVDDFKVKALTMKDPPSRTFAGMLQSICAIPSPLIACLEWQRLGSSRVRRDLHRRRRHFFNKKVSIVNYLSPQTRSEDMLVDDSATAIVNELGRALTALEVDGHVFGACSLTIVLFDQDARRLDQAVAECIKTFAGHDGALYEESYNLLNAWLAVVPGNAAHNLRRLTLLNTNVADLSFLFTLHAGERTSAHLGGRECLAVFETEHQTPFFWNMHHGDVGHALIQGATGSGKSFLANFLITHAQKYDPVTVIFDLGGSYDRLTRQLGGSVWRVGLGHRDFTINPFCLEPTDENLHFLFAFARVLIQTGNQHQLSLQEDRELYDAIESIYALDPPQRRLFTLANVLPRSLAEHLHRWVQGGPYAALFDHAEDTLTFQRVQCFDFEGLDQFPLVLEPLLFYVLHRASASIQDRATASTLKLFVLDEAWRFARDATVKAYVTEALKTWRKRKAAMWLATQTSDDFTDRELLRTVVESCPTKFFLANPSMDLDRARELFHLNHTEASLITTLRPREQVLLKRPDISKVLNLHVDPESRAIFANEVAAESGARPSSSQGAAS
jgi:type IV secretion/conjugal transfer VirB4 family ATPase